MDHSGCGVGSHLAIESGGTLDPKTFQVSGASAAKDSDVQMKDIESTQKEESSSSTAGVTIPAPPPLTPEMKGELAVTNSIRALSPRIVAVHGPTQFELGLEGPLRFP